MISRAKAVESCKWTRSVFPALQRFLWGSISWHILIDIE